MGLRYEAHPPRHIHIKYGDYEAIMELVNLNVIEGSLPKNAVN
jgi:hypothetical protein